jgi:hypothetical protein
MQILQERLSGGEMGKGRVILQDRKPVLDAVPDEQLPGVEKMVIDFFTPQPVKSMASFSLKYRDSC